MRFPWFATAIVLIVGGLVADSNAQASELWPWANPDPILNRINRELGLGWSHGYHAYGGRNSWSLRRPTQQRRPIAYPVTTIYWTPIHAGHFAPVFVAPTQPARTPTPAAGPVGQSTAMTRFK